MQLFNNDSYFLGLTLVPAKDSSRSLRRLRANGLRGVCQDNVEVSSGRKSFPLLHMFVINFLNRKSKVLTLKYAWRTGMANGVTM